MSQRANRLAVSCCTGMCALGLCASARAADIYRAESRDGSVRYSTQPLDASYKLFLEAERQRAAPSSASARRVATAPAQLEALVEQVAHRHGVEAALVKAIIAVESGFNAQALSPRGAAGLMQLMPAIAARYGVTDATDPAQNVDAGVRHFAALLANQQGSVELALASYNAGEGAVARHQRRIPPYRETMLYVAAVLARLQAERNRLAQQ